MLQFEDFTEKPCLCVRVSTTRGMLIIWIFILFPDIQNCPTIFVRKQTENMAPEEMVTDWDPSILNLPVVSVAFKKKSRKENENRGGMRNKRMDQKEDQKKNSNGGSLAKD